MRLTYDLVEQLEDMYRVKANHLKYLRISLPRSWQTTIPGGYADVWEQKGWKFLLKDLKPFPKPLRLLVPDKRRIVVWTMIANTNEIVVQVDPEGLEEFLDRHVDNPAARRNLTELFFGEDETGPGLKAFRSLAICAREENRFMDRYLQLLRVFAGNDPRQVGVDEELREDAINFLREIDDFHRYLDSDLFIFKRFSKDLKSLFRAGVRVGVQGYGEISSVLSLTGERGENTFPGSSYVFKKMPPFPDDDSVQRYRDSFEKYHAILEELGLRPPRRGFRHISREDGTYTVFITQARLPTESIGSNVVKKVNEEDCRRLFRMVLEETLKVAKHNREHPELLIGIDIQISNWGVDGYESTEPRVTGEESLYYVDTSTPMIRDDGQELLDPEIFMKSVPFFLRPIVRTLFLQDVLDRYYDVRAIIKDLIANFIKEGRPEVVPALVQEANNFFIEEMPEFGLKPVTIKQVRSYYRQDRMIWITFQTFRRIDRFIQEKILRRTYPFRLPDKIGVFAGRESRKD